MSPSLPWKGCKETRIQTDYLQMIKIHVSAFPDLDHLIRITWEASWSQSKSSGCVPRTFSSNFLGSNTQGSCRRALRWFWCAVKMGNLTLEVLLPNKPSGLERGKFEGLNLKTQLGWRENLQNFKTELATSWCSIHLKTIQSLESCAWLDGSSPQFSHNLPISKSY